MIEQQIADALADGRITELDAFEVTRFAAFLSEAGPVIRSPKTGRHTLGSQKYAALRKWYPEDPVVVLIETKMQSRCRGR